MKAQTLKSTVEKDLADIQSKIDNAKKELADNYAYAFEWGVAGQLYCLELEKRNMIKLLKAIIDAPNTLAVNLQRSLDASIEEILKGDFLGNSTSQYHNISHTHKKEVSCKMIERNKLYLQWITADINPMPIS